MNTIDYLELIQKNYQVKGKPCSDYRAAQLLGIGRSAISRYKLEGRQMEDDVAFRAAQLLDIDPAHVLADMQIERAKNPDIKATWQKIRNALLATAASIALAAILSPALLDFTANSAAYTSAATSQLILCKIVILSFIALSLSPASLIDCAICHDYSIQRHWTNYATR